MRNLIFTAFIIGIEILVVIHWFFFPDSPALMAFAMTAGVVMCGMALADLVLMVGVFRKDPQVPQHRQELHDLSKAEPVWVFATLVQGAFLVAAYMAGVYWMVVALVVGQGAELVSFAVARIRMRSEPPQVPAT